MGTSGLCPRGVEIPGKTTACIEQAGLGCLPGTCASFSHCQALLEGERELQSCLPSTDRHGDALNPLSLHHLSLCPTGEPPFYLLGLGSGF